jgi:hypothetical protein
MKFSLLFLAVVAPTTAFVVSPASSRQASSSRSSSALHARPQLLDRTTGKSQLDPAVIDRYDRLPYPAETILAEYVWVDAVGNTRSKTRTLPASKVRIRGYDVVVGAKKSNATADELASFDLPFLSLLFSFSHHQPLLSFPSFSCDFL